MIIELSNCSKHYKQGTATIVAVNLVSAQFGEGIHMVVGKSGSGKSTLLNMMAGFERPTEGKVIFNGRNIYERADSKQSNVGFVFQSYNLIPELCVEDNILLPLYIRRTKRITSYDAIIETLGLTDKLGRMPQTLSGGEQQRVAIARAIIDTPEVIFADEPTGNLDEVNSKIVIETLVDLCKKANSSLIMVTHDYDLLKYADNKYIIKDGSISLYI